MFSMRLTGKMNNCNRVVGAKYNPCHLVFFLTNGTICISFAVLVSELGTEVVYFLFGKVVFKVMSKPGL